MKSHGEMEHRLEGFRQEVGLLGEDSEDRIPDRSDVESRPVGWTVLSKVGFRRGIQIATPDEPCCSRRYPTL